MYTVKMSEIVLSAQLAEREAVSVSLERYVQSGLLFLFFALALFGNSAIIYQLWKGRHQSPTKKLSNISLLYFQLAIADLIAAFCCMLSNAILYLIDNFIAGDGVCKMLRFMQKLGLSSSTFIVVSISVDRCLAVLLPLHKLYLRKLVSCLIIGSWILGTLMSMPQVFIFQVNKHESNETVILQCDNSVGYSNPWEETAYDLANLICLYVLPLICISASYGLIVNAVSRQIKHPQAELVDSPGEVSNRTMNFIQAKKTSLAVSVVVVMTFVICWAPWYVTLMVHIIKRPDPTDDFYGNHAIYFCGLGHSVMNPLMYGAFNAWRRSQQTTKSGSTSQAVKHTAISRTSSGLQAAACHTPQRSFRKSASRPLLD